MKNDDRIVELLAESLKRQDQQADILNQLIKRQDQQADILNELIKRQDRLENAIITVVDEVKSLNKKTEDNGKHMKAMIGAVNSMADMFNLKFTQVNEHEKRITRLEDHLLK